MMRYNIDLFRKSFDDEVLCQQPPDGMTEFIRLVCAIAVKPDGTMCTHDHHAIDHHGKEQSPAQVIPQENKEQWQHTDYHDATDQRDPVSLVFKNIDPGKSFRP